MNMARLDTDRQHELEPKRIQFAIDQITNLGFEITYKDKTKIQFVYKKETVTLFPYSGWHTGKSIQDGRGIQNLIIQLDPIDHICKHCGAMTDQPDSECYKATNLTQS